MDLTEAQKEYFELWDKALNNVATFPLTGQILEAALLGPVGNPDQQIRILGAWKRTLELRTQLHNALTEHGALVQDLQDQTSDESLGRLRDFVGAFVGSIALDIGGTRALQAAFDASLVT